MPELEQLGSFYLGGIVDEDLERTAQPLMYDASELTTHAVIVGMTGSGKTGLGVALIEEAAIDGVPVLVVDPKGDMGNLALTFPDLRAEDFAPWIDPREAEREGTDQSSYAEQTAEGWRQGLLSWGQGPERIAKLRSAAGVTVYTPGSTAGEPISVLKSFAPPPLEVLEDAEAFADRLSDTAASLLTLLGRDPDPLGREHLLIGAVLEDAWRAGRELDLAGLVRAVQAPPVRRLGVMDIDTVFPQDDRMKLAMALNGLLASPSFDTWTRGTPLDLQSLLYEENGKPRVAVLTISHLNDQEREFFLTLLFSEVVSWTRSRTGTSSLRALVYVDELFGMLPPVAEPPTKRPLLTLLKQARAFGVGLALSTQNPVDLDYKALSNAGTWFIGRLQTERDRSRLLDGMASASGSVDVRSLDETIASLPKRTFVMRSVHEPEPTVFQTRWVMSYLAGPLSRGQITQLRELGLSGTTDGRSDPRPGSSASSRGDAAAEAGSEVAKGEARRTLTGDSETAGSPTRPVLPPHLPEIFVPPRSELTGVRYFPLLLGVADVFYQSKTHGVAEQRRVSLFVEPLEGPSPVEWSRGEAADVALAGNLTEIATDASFAPLPAVPLTEAAVEEWRELFERWLRTDGALALWRDPVTKLVSRPDESERDFRLRCAQTSRERRDESVAKLRSRFATKLATSERRLMREEQAVSRERQQLQARAASVATTVLGAILGRGRITTAVNRASMGAKDLGDVQRANDRLAEARREHADLERQLLTEIEEMTSGTVHPEQIELEPVLVRPTSRDIAMRFFGVAWVPHALQDGRWMRA